MKAVLISIQPKWVELIESGKKTVEVRKTRPKLETPFKCYIYETRGGTRMCRKCQEKGVCDIYNPQAGCYYGSGKVIGEFVCDEGVGFRCSYVPYRMDHNLGYGRFLDNGVYKRHIGNSFDDSAVVFERLDGRFGTMLQNDDLARMCLSAQNLYSYVGYGNTAFGWHISDLKIYDEPKELGEFRKPDTPIHSIEETDRGIVLSDGWKEGNQLTRPPQSWCYVEEI